MPEAGFPVVGSSPHTRGAPALGPAPGLPVGIIPAYAGSTSCGPDVHPSPGSSPHTRGAPLPQPVQRNGDRIIPAYAGSTAKRASKYPSTADHPRIRGEHALTAACRSRVEGSSPHTRGAPAARLRAAAGRRIIPAYAGSTVSLLSRARVEADHPRIRGEHHDHRCPAEVRRGSSPHTRGARFQPRRDR